MRGERAPRRRWLTPWTRRWLAPWTIARSASCDPGLVANTLALWCFLAGILLSALSLLRHYTFHSSLYDVGIFHQTLWNTARLRPFESSIKRMSYLGDHFSPSFGLLAPLEWLPRPLDWLFVAHAAATVFTAWNIFLLARRRVDVRSAWVLGMGTLFSPALYCPVLSDIHPEAFMAAALSRAFLDLDRKRYGLAALWMFLVLAGKEDVGLLLAPIGLVLALERPTRWFGVILAAAALAWMGLAIGVFMPALRPPAQPGAPWFYLGRFSHLGGSLEAIARSVLLHPVAAIAASTTVRKVVTLVLLLLPFGFFPLRSARTVAVVPFAAAHYFSLRWPEFFFPFHYLVVVVPVLAWAAIGGAARTPPAHAAENAARAAEPGGRLPSWVGWVVGACCVFSVIWRLDPAAYRMRPNHSALSEAISRIPDGEPVCVENWFGAHLSARRDVDFCVLWTWEREQYRYYGWPHASSARWQLFDFAERNDEHPGLAHRAAALYRAGAEVVLERDGVVLLRVEPDVIARAPAFVSPQARNPAVD